MGSNTIPPTDTGTAPPAGQPGRPGLDELSDQVLARSRDEKKALLYRLLRDLLGESPGDEYGIYNPDGSSYLFLLSPRRHAELSVTPEQLAQWQRDLASGQTVPLRETIARLESLNR